jgi:chemotaxis response regulator CheB
MWTDSKKFIRQLKDRLLVNHQPPATNVQLNRKLIPNPCHLAPGERNEEVPASNDDQALLVKAL